MELLAENSSTTVEELKARVNLIPSEVMDDYEIPTDITDELETALLVQKITDMMTEEQRIIAEGIMEGKSYREIASEMGKSHTWVAKQIQKVRDELLFSGE